MALSLSPEVLGHLLSQVAQDPGLPRENPTTAFWQLPPHKLSTIQSPCLPSKTNYVIIGSGITGCSIAKHLLDDPSSGSATLTVFEARTLTSGATGRNGGALTSFVPYDFNTLTEHFGLDEAIKIARYAHRTLEKMHQVGRQPGYQDVSEVRRLRDVSLFGDEESFKTCQASVSEYEKHVPECSVHPELLTAEEVKEKYNMKNGVGAMLFDCGAFWPYRLVTKLWEQMLMEYPDRLSIETNTPVTAIAYKPEADSQHPFVLRTPRGVTRAAKVIHATNGYSGHLLPVLRGKLYPLRGTMSTQKSSEAFGRYGDKRGWSISHLPRYDETTQVLETGLYYSNQNPKSNDIFIGGEKAPITEMFVADDSEVVQIARKNISSILPKYFEAGWKNDELPEVRNVWSGVLGFTGDGLPFVGSLPSSITERGEEGGEWIAAGFNGYGMPQCWSAGEAVAKMVLGGDVSDFLPQSYLACERRFKLLSAETALQRLLGV